MAKEAGATHKATPKKRKQAREEGNVGQSKDLTLIFSLFVFLIIVYLGEWFARNLYELILGSINLIEKGMPPNVFFYQIGGKAAKFLGTILAMILISMLVNYFVQVRFLFSLKVIKPQLKRLNPMNYFKRVFSKKTAFDVVKQFLIVIILGFVVCMVFKKEIGTMITAFNLPWQSSLVYMWGIFKSVIVKVVIVFGVIATADFFFQRYTYEDDLKMKLEDVKREQKEQNGSPEVRGRQRQQMMATLRNEVRQKVPEASFVITNPTHYAVAIRYDVKRDSAPIIVAKGIDHLALFIKEIANDSEIPIIENKELARDIYTRCVENEYVPTDMYMVISQILKELVRKGKFKM